MPLRPFRTRPAHGRIIEFAERHAACGSATLGMRDIDAFLTASPDDLNRWGPELSAQQPRDAGLVDLLNAGDEAAGLAAAMLAARARHVALHPHARPPFEPHLGLLRRARGARMTWTEPTAVAALDACGLGAEPPAKNPVFQILFASFQRAAPARLAQVLAGRLSDMPLPDAALTPDDREALGRAEALAGRDVAENPIIAAEAEQAAAYMSAQAEFIAEAGAWRAALRRFPGTADFAPLIDALSVSTRSKPPPTSGAPLERERAEARLALMQALDHAPGLWPRVAASWAGPWARMDHQIFPYFSETANSHGALRQAAQVGADPSDGVAKLEGLLDRAGENVALAKAGRTLPGDFAEFPDDVSGTVAHRRASPFWRNSDPPELRFGFSEDGARCLEAIVSIEARMIDLLHGTIVKTRQTFQENHDDGLPAELAPPAIASKPSKAWRTLAAERISPEKLDEIIVALRAWRERMASPTETRAADPIKSPITSRPRLIGMIWAAHLAGPTASDVGERLTAFGFGKVRGLGPADQKVGAGGDVAAAHGKRRWSASSDAAATQGRLRRHQGEPRPQAGGRGGQNRPQHGGPRRSGGDRS